MTTTNGIPWPQVIRRHVYEMTILVVLLGLIAVGYISWHRVSSDKIQRFANEYHLTSATHYIRAKEELRHLVSHQVYDLANVNIDTSLQEHAMEPSHEYNISASFYLVRQEVQAGLELQRTFVDGRFDSLIGRLEQRLSNFEEDGGNLLLKHVVFEQMFPNIRRLMITLEQLARLHAVVRDDLLIEMEAEERRQLPVFLVLVSVLLLFGFLIMKRGLNAIDAVVTERKQADEERERLLHNTGERVKELRCMYGLAESIRTRGTLEQVFKDTVALIPPGWQYPEITRARLCYADQKYVSQPFEETEWKQYSRIVVGGKQRGKVEVYYLQECPELDEGPFLTEERNLLDGMANALSEAIEHVQAEKGRVNSEKQLRQALKMDAVGQLTGGIAHDFNNILGIIIGNLNLLKGGSPSDDQAFRRMEIIYKSALRAADLTKQLLSFSRKQPMEVTVTDIGRVIRNMDSLIARSVTPQIVVDHHFCEGLWLTEIDCGDFQDALINLIINARDAMPGGGRLTLEADNKVLDDAYCTLNPGATPGEYVQLAVSDSGQGIPHDEHEHIFEPFYTTKEQGRGTGLGLAMVYGFVKRSGGYIKVYSELDVGSTFRIYLPRAKGEEPLAQAITEQSERLPGGTETILAVDDERGLLELAQVILEELGYRVLTATSGRQALQLLAEEPGIALLFSDVVMPGGMNGNELAEQATAVRPALKVLLTSGYTKQTLAHSGQVGVVADLLAKPYTPRELARRIRMLLGEDSQPR